MPYTLYVTRTTMRLHPELKVGDFITDSECPCEVCVAGGPGAFSRGVRMHRDKVRVDRQYVQESLLEQLENPQLYRRQLDS